MRALRALVIVLFALWAAVGLLLWWFQERLLFPGAYADEGAVALALDPEAARVAGATPRRLTTADGVHVLSWHYAHGGRGTVLYVGGNAEHVASSRALAEALRAQGWDLLVLVPRGFPGSEGAPSEEGFARDMRAAWAYLTGPLHLRPEQIVVHGRSMGGGVVGLLLDEIRPAGWVFESTYDSLDEMAWHQYPFYPVSWLLRFHLATVRRANLAHGPVLQVHAATDEVIPLARAQALADALRDGTFIVAPTGDHQRSVLSAWPEARAAWEALLAGAAR